ncbi:MAG: PAS domain S-box protein, partial [Rhodothermia bacterium]
MDSLERRQTRILLVEDDSVDRMAVERLFARNALPYELVCAGTIAEAMEIHREHPLDLAFLDHGLPDGTGLELQALLEDIPCVFVTAQKDVLVAIEAMKDGAYDFLVKDTERTYLELFPSVIERALEVHGLKREVRRHADELDGLVIARTRELEEANKRLREEVNERETAEKALRKSEARARALLATVPDMMFRIRRDGTYLAYMPGRGIESSASPEKYLGKKVSEVMPPNLTERAMQDIERALDTGAVVEHEYDLLMGDELLSREYRLASCGEDEVIALVRDITERKRAEHELWENRSRLLKAQRIAKMGFLNWDLRTDEVDLSDEIIRLYGLDPETKWTAPDLVAHVIHPEDLEFVKSELQAAVTGERELNIDHRVVRPDGDVIWVHARADLIRDDEGNAEILLGTALDITERVEAERETRAIRDQLQLSVDRMPVAYIMWDPDGNVTHWNLAAERIFGFTSEEAVGRRLLDLIVTKEARPLVAEIHARLVAGDETSYSEPGNNLRKDGTVLSCQWFNTPLIDATGEVSGVLSMVLDVTERQLAQVALRESEEKLSEAQRIAKLGYYELDVDTGRWTSSAELDDVFGMDDDYPRDLDGWLRLVHPEFRERMGDYFKHDVLTQHERFDKEYIIIDQRTGQEKWVHGLGNLVCDDLDNPVGMFGTIQDITDRKRAEEELRRNEVIVASSSNMLALLDKDYTYLAVNAAYLKPFGMTRDQLVGSTLSELFGEEFLDRVIMPHADRCLGGEEVHYQEWFDFPGSAEAYMDVTYRPYFGADDEVRGFVVDARDITEHQRAEEALREEHERSRLILQTSMDGFILADTTGDLVDVNPSFCRMVGYAREELLRMNLRQLEVEPLAMPVGERTQQVLRDGSARFETQHRHRKGALLDFDISAFVMQPEGGPPLLAAFIRDTTEQKTVEACLFFVAQGGWTEQGEGFLRLLTTHLGETLGVEYALICEILPGRTSARTTGFYAAGELVPNAEYDLEHTPCRGVMDGQHCIFPRDVQQRFQRDQMLADMDVEGYAAIPLWGSSGEPIGLVGVMDTKPLENPGLVERVLQTVAVRAASELEYKRMEEERRATEKRFSSLFEHMPIALWEEDFSDVLSYLEELGFSEIEDFPHYLEQRPDVVEECLARVRVISVSDAAISLHGADTKEELLANLNRAFTARSYEAFRKELVAMWRGEDSCEIEADLRTLSGAIRQTIIRWSVPPGGDGSYSRVLVSVSDVTELETARANLREMNLALEHLVE